MRYSSSARRERNKSDCPVGGLNECVYPPGIEMSVFDEESKERMESRRPLNREETTEKEKTDEGQSSR